MLAFDLMLMLNEYMNSNITIQKLACVCVLVIKEFLFLFS